MKLTGLVWSTPPKSGNGMDDADQARKARLPGAALASLSRDG